MRMTISDYFCAQLLANTTQRAIALFLARPNQAHCFIYRELRQTGILSHVQALHRYMASVA